MQFCSQNTIAGAPCASGHALGLGVWVFVGGGGGGRKGERACSQARVSLSSSALVVISNTKLVVILISECLSSSFRLIRARKQDLRKRIENG